AVQRMIAVVEHEKPTAAMVLGPIHLEAATAGADLADAIVEALGTRIQITAVDGDLETLSTAIAAAAPLGDLLAGDLVPIDERAADLRITRGTSDQTAAIRHRLLYSLTAFDTFFIYWGVADGSTIDLDVSVANAAAPMVRDAVTGSRQQPGHGGTDARGKRLHFTLPGSDHPLILDFNFGTTDTYTESSEVQKETLPRVEEVIFRYRQTQAAQDAALHNYVAHVRIEQHFHPSPA